METQTLTLSEFLLARFAEDEVLATPRTVVVSGGTPAPVVPNCIGPSGTGDCPVAWRLGDVGVVTPEIKALMDQHSLTHATPTQRRALAECEAKRRLLDWLTPVDAGSEGWYAMRLLALPYADHPDYRPEWRAQP